MVETFGSFAEFVEKLVLPCRAAHPEWRRLDGQAAVGNRNIIAFVKHESDVFCVHEDAWIESLIAPYNALKQQPDEPALVVALTRGGVRKKLQPAPGKGSSKGFYIYQYP